MENGHPHFRVQTPTSPADMLGDLLASLIDGRPVDDTTREWAVRGILSAIRRDESLDLALGLAGTGKTRLHDQLLMIQRDEHLHAALQSVALDDGVSTWQRCQRLAIEADRFMRSTWPKTKRLSAPPDHWPEYARHLWHAARTDTRLPTTASGLYGNLSRNKGFSQKATGGKLLSKFL
jgi:hypothetical protein